MFAREKVEVELSRRLLDTTDDPYHPIFEKPPPDTLLKKVYSQSMYVLSKMNNLSLLESAVSNHHLHAAPFHHF